MSTELFFTGVDLSKILGGQTKILGEKVLKGDRCMSVSQLLGARAWAAHQSLHLCSSSNNYFLNPNSKIISSYIICHVFLLVFFFTQQSINQSIFVLLSAKNNS